MPRPRTPHPEGLVCARHPNAPRRWKRVFATGFPHRTSVCSVCAPKRGGDTCVNGHRNRRRRRADGHLECSECTRLSSKAFRRRVAARATDILSEKRRSA